MSERFVGTAACVLLGAVMPATVGDRRRKDARRPPARIAV